MSASQHKSLFDINQCRAKMYGASELVDCLVPAQAYFCGHSLSFGFACFCKHPKRAQFVERTAKSRSSANALSVDTTNDHDFYDSGELNELGPRS